MKKLSLTVKIWLAMTMVSLLLYLGAMLSTPSFIRGFFVDSLMEPQVRPEKNITEHLPPYINISGFRIRGFMLLDDGTTLPASAAEAIPPALLQEIWGQAKAQQSSRQMYEGASGELHIRYGISKDNVYGHWLYQVNFFRRSEEEQFVSILWFKIMLYAGVGLLISWFASLLIVRYLTRPLVQMQQHVKRIANRNWHDPLTISRGDEIGQLAGSIESMRRQLVQQDEAQQSLLQNISHELKTPVMVIRSYARAMQEGVYPKGDLAGSIQVIDEEGERLEKLVKQLLYLTRLDYLSGHSQNKKSIDLEKLTSSIAQRLKHQRPHIDWSLELQPVSLGGDEDILRVLLENLLDNHLRYAASRLEIKLHEKVGEILLYIWNDGSRVEPHVLCQLFQPFEKGRDGKYGLGLTIAQRIVKMYDGKISLANERDGVATMVVFFRDKER